MSSRLPVEHDEKTELPAPKAPAASAAATLVVVGPGASRTHVLSDPGAVLIGRADTADIQLDARAVSRSHARLTLQQGEAVLADLGSSNGTFVNGERLTAPRILRPNDVVTLGTFSLVYDRPGPSAARPHEALEPGHAGPLLRIGDRVVVVAEPAMSRTYALVRKLARSNLSVLVLGETGVGKESISTALHHWSDRRNRRLVAINCAAVPESLIESELFGHEKGAFSGAISTKVGLLERAEGGTVVLDEIGELALGAQAKLLRVLETHRLNRIGDVEEREIDVRVVASTNRNLAKEARAGTFRQDLFFRLSGGMVWVPPLRERPAEIPLLATTFLEEALKRAGQPHKTLSAEARDLLCGYSWPGNVRELKNLMEYLAATIGSPVVEAADVRDSLGAEIGFDSEPPLAREDTGLFTLPGSERRFRPIDEEVRELECDRIRAALVAAGGNQTRAAELIGMPLRTFISKRKLYGIARTPDPPQPPLPRRR